MENNPYQPPRARGDVAGGNPRAGQWDRRNILVACLYLLIVISGVSRVTRPESGALTLVLWALTAWSATYWCVIDSRTMGRPIVQSLHWIIFFTWPIAAPVYLVSSRGLRGLGFAAMHAIALFIVLTLAYFLAGYVAYGDAWLSSVYQ